MLEALWSVEFVSNLEAVGAGVAVFETGRVFGGDSQYYYLGSFRVVNGVAKADIEVNHYFGPLSSIFGPLTKFNLKLTGQPNNPVMELSGHLVENPKLQIYIRLTKRADLP